jgi:hypothetical protein
MNQPMREEMIGNAVDFLLDSRVASSTEEKKRNFLLQKGLSEREINEAFVRANQSSPQMGEVNGGQQQPIQVPMEIPWKTLGFVIVLCVAFGNSLQSLIVKYVIPFWFGAKEKKATDTQIEELKTQLTQTTEKAKTQIQEIQESLVVVKRFISNQQDNLRIVRGEKEQEDLKMSIIQEEVNSITHMLPQLINPIMEKRNEPKKDDENATKAKEPTVPWKRKDLSESSKKPDWLNSQEPIRLNFLDDDAKKKEEEEKKKEADENNQKEESDEKKVVVEEKEANNEKKEDEDTKKESDIKEDNNARNNNNESLEIQGQPVKQDNNDNNTNTNDNINDNNNNDDNNETITTQ